MSISQPIRYPDPGSTVAMTKRAWWLIVLNFLLPGSAQVVAGNRRLGRFGIAASLLFLALLALILILFFGARSFLLGLATNSWFLLFVQVLGFSYAALWLVLTLDTLRLVRLVRVAPGSRLVLAVGSLVVLGLLGGSAAYGAVLAGAQRDLLVEVFADGQIEEPINGRYNILLLGGDAGADRLGLRPDSISVASIDAETGATSIIGVPRNFEFIPFSKGSPLWDEFPNGYNCGDECLISYLYTYAEEHPDLYPDAEDEGSAPGIEATKDAVEGVLGIPLQYYVLIDMQGFEGLVDALGGVKVTVDERLPIGGLPDRHGELVGIAGWIEPGTQVMNGYTALWYARSRYTTNDFDRMKRQRELQEAILVQFEPGNLLSKYQAIAKAGSQTVRTNIPEGMLARFVELALSLQELPDGITRLELSPPDYDPAHPDYDQIHADVAELLEPVVAESAG